MESFGPKDDKRGLGGSSICTDLKRQKRGNGTHACTTNGEVMLIRKGLGLGARLSFTSHTAMENRHGLCRPV